MYDYVLGTLENVAIAVLPDIPHAGTELFVFPET